MNEAVLLPPHGEAEWASFLVQLRMCGVPESSLTGVTRLQFYHDLIAHRRFQTGRRGGLHNMGDFAGHLMHLGFFLYTEAQEHQPLCDGYIKVSKL